MVRRFKSYKRGEPVREPYDSVLIVCEGSKSEPNYLRALCVDQQLSAVNVRVVASPGSDPMSVVNYALGEVAKAVRDKLPYDRVYCVFDRDGHSNYDQAIATIKNSTAGKQGAAFAITSLPCFEVWVLLHFTYSDAPFGASGGRSSCDNVIRKIKEHFPEYSKGHTNLPQNPKTP